MANIRLHEVHQVTGAEIKKAILCERSLSSGQRNLCFLPQECQLSQILQLSRFLHKEWAKIFNLSAKLDGHDGGQLSVSIDANVKVVSNAFADNLHLLYGFAHGVS